MFEEIRNCKNCNLCRNQQPLLESCQRCDVMWVGLSAKKVKDVESAVPLDETTRTGKVIAEIEKMLDGVSYYKTNVVKCVPLDENGKLRYPSRQEMNTCVSNLESEIEHLSPKVVFLLGEKAKSAVAKKYHLNFHRSDELFHYQGVTSGHICFYAIEHPSYVSIYKRKRIEDYKKAVVTSIETVLG